MSNNIVLNILRFLGLIIVQLYVFNNMNIFGYINPLPYVLFVIVFPFSANRSLYLFLAFLTGLTLDMFGNSGGIHAAACLFVAFSRPVVTRFVYGVSYEYNAVKLSKGTFYERVLFILILVVIHHLVFFSLEVFNIASILYILKKALITSVGTALFCVLFSILFSGRSE
ncbi:rod shape-determining protein MreD [Dokdonia sinensis]|uniref:Rod shape-determining protein MreD n=1 Tax=Dokdonia sinensis TaxID=2479847 RepID=A0A3M0FXU6_9FLAO|nr:rod shape-determining protein MreD [Dokdonia sinensis]RMB56757.1 rod shape-determining protein MreD [Dokdonia sinensis]